MTGPRDPKPVDQHVGARIRLRRQVLKMSQEKLGRKLGVTFQQVQKYERGTNRVGASRLWDLSTILDVPVSYFFEGLARSDDTHARHQDLMFRTISSHDGHKFMEALDQIEGGDVRRQLLSLIRTLAGDEISNTD